MHELDVEGLRDLLAVLAEAGVAEYRRGDTHIVFGGPRAQAPVRAPATEPEPVANPRPPRDLRAIAEAQGIGPLKFPRAEAEA